MLQDDSPKSTDTKLLPPKSGAKRAIRLVAKLVVIAATLVLAWYFLQGIGWEALSTRIRSADGFLISAAIAIMLLRFVAAYLRWLQPLRLLHLPLSHFYAFCSLLTAVLLNHLTPTARLLGGVVRARYISKRYSTLFSRAYGTALIDQVSHQVVQGVTTWFAMGLLAWQLGWKAAATTLLVLLLASLIGVVIWRRRHRLRGERPVASLLRLKLQRQARRLGPLYAGGKEVAELFRRALEDTPLQVRMAICGTVLLLANAAAQWLIFQSLGTDVGFLEVIVTVAVGIVAGMVSNTPGGFATTEAAMIAIYVGLGVPEIEAAAGALIYRGLHYLMVVGLGVPALVYCESTSSSKSKDPDRSAPADRSANEMPDSESPPD